jgi:hypothetical protein
MDATSFELIVSVSLDPRLAATVREVIVCATQYAGCANAAGAAAFAKEVEAAVSAVLSEGDAGAMLPVTVRRNAGPIEVLVNGHVLTFRV